MHNSNTGKKIEIYIQYKETIMMKKIGKNEYMLKPM